MDCGVVSNTHSNAGLALKCLLYCNPFKSIENQCVVWLLDLTFLSVARLALCETLDFCVEGLIVAHTMSQGMVMGILKTLF